MAAALARASFAGAAARLSVAEMMEVRGGRVAPGLGGRRRPGLHSRPARTTRTKNPCCKSSRLCLTINYGEIAAFPLLVAR